MPVQEKYYMFFTDPDNLYHTVRIYQDTPDTIVSENIWGEVSPFVTSWPEANNKLDPVRGSGCTIRLLSRSNMKFLGLYTAKIKEYRIEHLIDGQMHWHGWLDSEIYSEPFDALDNYPVEVSGTDGFALLDRMQFLSSLETKLTGIWTEWDALRMAVQKIGLPFKFLYFQCATEIQGVTLLAGETIMHRTFFQAANFYNEDGEPETMRVVLEKLLNKYGLYIIQSNGSLFIMDVETLLESGNFILNKYTIPGLSFISVEYGFGKTEDISTIGFSGTGQTLNIVPAINKQVVAFSPYIKDDILEFTAGTDDFTEQGETSGLIGTFPYQWTETTWGKSYTFDKFDGGGFYNSNWFDVVWERNYYQAVKKSFTEANANLTKQYSVKLGLPFVVPMKAQLKVTVKGYFRLSNDYENPNYTPSLVKFANLYMDIIVGNYKATNNNGWVAKTDTAQLFRMGFGNYELDTPIEDQWLDAGRMILNKDQVGYTRIDYLIPLATLPASGQMEINMNGYVCYRVNNNQQINVLDARFNDLSVQIVDMDGNEFTNEDIEYVGYVNPTYKSEGEKVELLLGSSYVEGAPIRGGLVTGSYGAARNFVCDTTTIWLIYPNSNDLSLFNVGDLITGNPAVPEGSKIVSVGILFADIVMVLTIPPTGVTVGVQTTFQAPPVDASWLHTWVRDGYADRIENLLLRSIMKQYNTKAIKLTFPLNNRINTVGFLTYNSQLPGKKFMITAMKNDYEAGTSEVVMEEILETDITLIHSQLWLH
jgi:hypothetical protein